jgi:hypothetical protein
MNIITHSELLVSQTNSYSFPTETALNYIDVSVDGIVLIEDEGYSIYEEIDLTIHFTPSLKANSTLLVNYELMGEIISTYIAPPPPPYFKKLQNRFYDFFTERTTY